jgi:hypothetical protein
VFLHDQNFQRNVLRNKLQDGEKLPSVKTVSLKACVCVRVCMNGRNCVVEGPCMHACASRGNPYNSSKRENNQAAYTEPKVTLTSQSAIKNRVFEGLHMYVQPCTIVCCAILQLATRLPQFHQSCDI